MTDLIPLQTAYIRQSKDVKDNTWVVFDTEGNEIAELANTLDPREAMSYLHFARPFELAALNEGIRFGKQEAKHFYEGQLANAKMFVDAVNAENERLSMKLLQMIEEGA